MSWQSYVDEQLVGTGNITQAAIVGLDGNAWAQSAGFGLKVHIIIVITTVITTIITMI